MPIWLTRMVSGKTDHTARPLDRASSAEKVAASPARNPIISGPRPSSERGATEIITLVECDSGPAVLMIDAYESAAVLRLRRPIATPKSIGVNWAPGGDTWPRIR